MRQLFIILSLVLSLSAFAVAAPIQIIQIVHNLASLRPLRPANALPDDWRSHMLALVNAERARFGKSPLQLDSRLNAAAQEHSNYQYNIRQVTHYDSSGPLLLRIARHIPGMLSAAENVAYGYSDVQRAVDGWIKSDGHHINILGDYKKVGFGEANRYWTQMFSK
ncbi:hypothetical protein DL89DRAFT_269998 [Linderina pennispora]|uniref:SCP domain-containing protein n=1 Tax=Linderina pennispora TaxID=61395 RepID=A0A1Y1VYV2_9FUNG|nr:uncharacterized protein DL89DRAFT_269998 [Linderina pennispora]ORX66440.1 hypothetical protein DL89DRAFT_269998 [Linderina pennispora]